MVSQRSTTALPQIAAHISGLGISLPQKIVASSEIDAKLKNISGSLEQACGVRTRHVATDESQESMAAKAALGALADANLNITDIDVLMFGAAVGRQPIPATAPLIKRLLNAEHCDFPCFDINATCLSFLVAMDQAAMHIATGRAKHVLVTTSEIASRALPWQSAPETAGLFGDGAAACVMSATDQHTASNRLGTFHMETYAEGYDHCSLQSGGTRYDVHTDHRTFLENAYFQMDGRALYKLSSQHMPEFIQRLLNKAQWKHNDVDLVVPHQASPHALAHLSRRCGFDEQRVFDIVADIGNQVAASIPIALYKARAAQRLESGMKVLLLGTSAGVSLGGATLTV